MRPLDKHSHSVEPKQIAASQVPRAGSHLIGRRAAEVGSADQRPNAGAGKDGWFDSAFRQRSQYADVRESLQSTAAEDEGELRW